MPADLVNTVDGFRCAGVACGIKPAPAPDLGLLVADAPCRAVATFTTNHFAAAPVRVSREHLARSRGRVRAVIVNSGNANACTGSAGRGDALKMCAVTARLLGVKPHEVLVASTGPIGHTLPMHKVVAGIEAAVAGLSPAATAGRAFARAILTTDNGPKTAAARFSAGGKRFNVAGAAKGAGMICPRMATLLSFLTTDVGLPVATLRRLLRSAVNDSFNAITVDGHTSTNDSVFLLSSGTANVAKSRQAAVGKGLGSALAAVCGTLAEAIVLDGEGATKATTVRVTGARSDRAAATIARTVAESPLVRTALFGNDRNWGRIVSAVGYAEGVRSVDKLRCRINGTVVFQRGRPEPFDARKVAKSLEAPRAEITVELAEGTGQARVVTSDLTYEYIRINAEAHT